MKKIPEQFLYGGKVFAIIENSIQYHNCIGKHAGLTRKESESWFYPDNPITNAPNGKGDMFLADPDYLIRNGVTYSFTSEKIGDVVYICTDALNKKLHTLITSFLDDSPEWVEVKSSWDVFNSLQTGIAFRGGPGYTYSIYEYQPQTENGHIKN